MLIFETFFFFWGGGGGNFSLLLILDIYLTTMEEFLYRKTNLLRPTHGHPNSKNLYVGIPSLRNVKRVKNK